MPQAAATLRLDGLREINQSFNRFGPRVKEGLKNEFVRVGEPVRSLSEELAVEKIRNIGEDWSRMRLGVTASTVYVAPQARRRRGHPGYKRPNLAVLLLEDAMFPALDRSEPAVLAGVEKMLDRIADREGF